MWFSVRKIVYFDNAATTKTDPRIFRTMRPYFLKEYGNASEPHFLGQTARKAIEESRGKVAEVLNAADEDIVFTGSATESINLAVKGLVESIGMDLKEGKPHIITCSVEHKAVLETCKHLEMSGLADVTYVSVDRWGMVSIKEILRAIKSRTVLISIMYVNNEVGTIQPIIEIGQLVKKINSGKKKVFFHSDATQAVSYLKLDVDSLGVDLLSFTGHKIYAPKGVGVLYLRKGTPLRRQIDGGQQEFGLRAGTENVPYIVALSEAVKLTSENQVFVTKRVRELTDRLINGLTNIKGLSLTGHPTQRAPHIASFVVNGVEGEAMVLLLSNQGIITSTGSACASGDLRPSHVLLGMGIKQEFAHGSIRFSLGKDNTAQEVDYVIETFSKVITQLREMAPKI